MLAIDRESWSQTPDENWYDAFCEQALEPQHEPNLEKERTGDRISIDSHHLSCLACCPSARMALATHPIFNSPMLLVVPCKRWGCLTCARQKIRRIAFDVHAAAPNRLLTLTVDAKLHDNAELAWLSTRDKPSEFFKAIRRRGIKTEYMKVTEVTKKGMPHYHCLLRSDFLPQKVAKRVWADLTGATIVDIRQVTNQFNAVQYLVKYLTKLHRPDWTERAISYSRGFFPAPLTQTDYEADASIKITQHSQEHPYAFLQRHFNGRHAVRLSPYRWLLNEDRNSTETEPDYAGIGIRPPAAEQPITISQRHAF